MMAMAWMLTAAETPHPRPDFERKAWQPLNGIWEFQFDPDDKGLMEGWQQRHHPFETTIRVPFGWESPLSGVHRPDYKGVAWYRRAFTLPTEWQNRRIWLCFGAVDWQAQVWVNGKLAGMHEGGYSEFRLDITALVRFDAPNRLVVRVEDRTDPETPLGKQIPNWYTSTSGIWQTVWLEATGDACIKRWRILPEGDAHGVPTGQVQLHIEIERGAMDAPLTVQVRSPQRRFAAAVSDSVLWRNPCRRDPSRAPPAFLDARNTRAVPLHRAAPRRQTLRSGRGSRLFWHPHCALG
jgi:hypothetical protein